MEQRTGSKLGKEYVKAVYCHLAYLTYMQSTLCKMLGWMKLSCNQDWNINNLRITDDTTLMAEHEEELKNFLMKGKEQSGKAGLKLNIQNTKIMASGPFHSLQIDGETMETVTDFISLGFKIPADGDCFYGLSYFQWLTSSSDFVPCSNLSPTPSVVMTKLILTPAAAKSPQSCPTLCDPIDGSPLGSSIPGILQASRASHIFFPGNLEDREEIVPLSS